MICKYYNCSGLTSITIPESVTSIGRSAFFRCSGLTSIKVEVGNTIFDSRENCNAIIETATNTLIAGCQNTVIPESVTSIGDGAFWYCSGLKSIIIPNSVTSIGNWAFSGCSDLTSITIPESVTSIGSSAFYGCSGLKSVSIPESVTSIGGSAFSNCSSLTSITIPKSVISIGNSTFCGCSGLSSIKVEEGNTKYDSRDNCHAIIETATNTLIEGCQNTVIPNSVTSIGERAFYDCDRLNSITIPNSVTNIGQSAFSGCSNLTSITIPSSVTNIGQSAFSGCSNLTSITIPSSVTNIGQSAFSGCYFKYDAFVNNTTLINDDNWGATVYDEETSDGLQIKDSIVVKCRPWVISFSIPESVTNIRSNAFKGTAWYDSQPDGLVYIGKIAYKYKGKMPEGTQITIKEGTIGIADGAFYGCSGLTSINIPESVTSIGSGAFRDCTSLTSINIPESVTSIGDWAFVGTAWYRSQKGVVYAGKIACGKRSTLYSITIKEGTMGIADGAFEYCDFSTRVTIPASVTSIGMRAFSDCNELTDVYCLAEEVPKTGRNAFTNTPIKKATLHVPAASVGKYKAASPWSNFGKIVAIEE